MTTDTFSPVQVWIMAARLKTLPAAVAPVLVGVGLAVRDDAFALLPALAALLGALLLQVGVNLANDYFDYQAGVDTGERKGPQRVTQSGLLKPEQVRTGIIVIFTLAALIGIYLIVVGGWPILVIGLASILSALAYSGGPFPLASHGLGDLFVFIFFGLAAVGGTYYVQSLTITTIVMLAAVPPGLLITAILVINNLRDIETDHNAGKNTLAVMLGQRGTRIEYVVLLAVAYLIPTVLSIIGEFSIWVLLVWITLPLATRLIRTLPQSDDGPLMNKTLAGTAQLSLLFSILFTVGLVL